MQGLMSPPESCSAPDYTRMARVPPSSSASTGTPQAVHDVASAVPLSRRRPRRPAISVHCAEAARRDVAARAHVRRRAARCPRVSPRAVPHRVEEDEVHRVVGAAHVAHRVQPTAAAQREHPRARAGAAESSKKTATSPERCSCSPPSRWLTAAMTTRTISRISGIARTRSTAVSAVRRRSSSCSACSNSCAVGCESPCRDERRIDDVIEEIVEPNRRMPLLVGVAHPELGAGGLAAVAGRRANARFFTCSRMASSVSAARAARSSARARPNAATPSSLTYKLGGRSPRSGGRSARSAQTARAAVGAPDPATMRSQSPRGDTMPGCGPVASIASGLEASGGAPAHGACRACQRSRR